MNSLLETVDLLFAAEGLPGDSTGSLAEIAEWLKTLHPRCLVLANGAGSLLATFGSNGALAPDALRRAVKRLAARLAEENPAFVDGVPGSADEQVFGVRLDLCGLLAVVLSDVEDPIALKRLAPVLRSCGLLALKRVKDSEEIGRLKAAVRQLIAEQDTLKAAHAKAIAEAVAEQEQRVREEQQREAMQKVCQATEAANRAKSEFWRT